MRAGGRQQPGPHEDARFSQLYQQVTEMQAPRFGAGYDVEKGLDRYRAWISEHVGQDGHAADPADDGASLEPVKVTATATATATASMAAVGAFPPDAFGVSGTVRPEWSADRAVIELYSQHYRALVRLAALLVRDTPTAEEVVQDSFVAMSGGWQRLRDTEKALAYLRQAVVNRSRSVLRHRTVVDKNLQKAPPDMPSAEHGALVLLERSAVVAALRGLPDRQREALVLRYYADLSEAEIATAMGISRGAVKSHTARGMSALRNALEQE
jgi:RNA polymerase sigma-70 factor (sigma-E family)